MRILYPILQVHTHILYLLGYCCSYVLQVLSAGFKSARLVRAYSAAPRGTPKWIENTQTLRSLVKQLVAITNTRTQLQISND